MRGRKLIFTSILAVFLVSGISLGSARAVEFTDWEDTWLKVKVEMKAVCEDLDFPERGLFKESVEASAWIYIENYNEAEGEFNAYFISMEENGEWQKTEIDLLVTLGAAEDFLVESAFITFADSTTNLLVGVCFTSRLKAGEKGNGELKNRELTSVTGESVLFLPGEADCVASLKIYGPAKDEKKVPDEVKELVL